MNLDASCQFIIIKLKYYIYSGVMKNKTLKINV